MSEWHKRRCLGQGRQKAMPVDWDNSPRSLASGLQQEVEFDGVRQDMALARNGREPAIIGLWRSPGCVVGVESAGSLGAGASVTALVCSEILHESG